MRLEERRQVDGPERASTNVHHLVGCALQAVYKLFCKQFRDNSLVEWETLTQPVIKGSIVLPLPYTVPCIQHGQAA